MGNMASTTAVLRANPRRKKGLHPETAIQIGIMNHLRQMMQLQKYQRFMAFHVPNGGRRSAGEARLLKEMGVMAGVADLVVMVPTGRIHQPPQNTFISNVHYGFYMLPSTILIELKHRPSAVVKKGGVRFHQGARQATRQSPEQEAFQKNVTGLGFDYRVVAATDERDGLKQVLGVMAEYGVAW